MNCITMETVPIGRLVLIFYQRILANTEQNLAKSRIDMESVGNSNDVILICNLAKAYSKFTESLWLLYCTVLHFVSSFLFFRSWQKKFFLIWCPLCRGSGRHQTVFFRCCRTTADFSRNLQNNNFKMLKWSSEPKSTPVWLQSRSRRTTRREMNGSQTMWFINSFFRISLCSPRIIYISIIIIFLGWFGLHVLCFMLCRRLCLNISRFFPLSLLIYHLQKLFTLLLT